MSNIDTTIPKYRLKLYQDTFRGCRKEPVMVLCQWLAYYLGGKDKRLEKERT